MTLTEMTLAANNYTDENFDNDVTIDFANKAISKINLTLGSTLPFISEQSVNYSALGDTWIHAIVVPYICWGIKMNDGSIEEAREYLYQIEDGLIAIKRSKKSAVAEEYRGESFNNVHRIKQFKGRYDNGGRGSLTSSPDSNNPLGGD